jgi:tetratricopeptide (TPR) repeat protein
MSKDISNILKTWEFSSEDSLVRRIIGNDGREKIQRRVDLGVLQMESEGRPDGVTPYGFPSLYDYLKNLFEEYEENPTDEEFNISPEDCEALQAEALLYYQRRLCFFDLQDYTSAARDARRNLELFAFIRRNAEREEDIINIDQFRGFVIYHRAKAEVLGCLEKKEYDFALNYIDHAERQLMDFYAEYGRGDEFEEGDEYKQLEMWREQIDRLRPLSHQEILQNELTEAVAREEYERAAEIRNEIQRLNHEKNEK